VEIDVITLYEVEIMAKHIEKKRNIWKILSIIFIVLFLFVLVSGVWRAYHFKHSFTKATPAQIDLVKGIAMTDLTSKGINISGLSFKVSNEIRDTPKSSTDSNTRQILEVSATNASVRYMYIIDITSSDILVYSMTVFYDDLNHTGDRPMDLHDIPRNPEPFRR
jgi:hypothetical protein